MGPGGIRCLVDPDDVEPAAGPPSSLQRDASQLAVAFGSIWVSETDGDEVLRLDPTTGDVQARIDVGAGPLKLQPADGALWVRTDEAYVRIDPATNTIAATLPKTQVGPAANRSWTVDDALWICDATTLHRYHPATLTEVTVIPLDFDCGQVYATDDLAIAWSYNQDPGESGTSRAALIDPRSNTACVTCRPPR